MLLITPKDAFDAEVLVFSNIFGFPAVNSTSKWTKTVNFRYVPFEPKFNISKHFSNTVFSLLETTSGHIFSKSSNICPKRAKNIPKRSHFISAESIEKTLKIFNFTTTSEIYDRYIS